MSDARRGLESQAHSVPKGRGLRCDILQEPWLYHLVTFITTSSNTCGVLRAKHCSKALYVNALSLPDNPVS